MRGRAAAIAFVVAQTWGAHAHAQEPPNLPPPPPPTWPQQYNPPANPQPTQTQPLPPSRRDRDRDPPPRHERETPTKREREREPVVVVQPHRYVAPPPPRDEPPPPRRGFQLALRTGVTFPLGSVSAGDAMSKDFAAQVPLFLEVGYKLHPMIFLGAYAALSIGGASSSFKNAEGCGDGGNRSCLASSLRLGVEAQVHFQPAERIDPWAGYGIGFEQASVSSSGGGIPEASLSLTGIEFARLAGGVDVRLSRLFGIGPYAELAFGTYSHAHVSGPLGQGAKAGDSDITDSSLHVWPTIGLRGVFFP